MRTVAVWTAFVLAYSSSPLVAGIRYTDPIPGQSGNTGDIVEKHADLNEPTCDELRAMWRYTKRQSRAAKTSTGYLYSDPFSYNMWRPYPERPKPALNYRGKIPGRARNRAGAPIYGRMVHKVPAGSILRNGMRHSLRPFDKTRFYGTINPYPPSPRRRVTSFRTMGGGPPPLSQASQAGSFDHLKDLLRAVRARELQEQHEAEELAERSYAFKEPTDDDYPLNIPRKQLLKPTLRIPTKIDYEFGQGRYPSNVQNIGQAWTDKIDSLTPKSPYRDPMHG